MSIKLDSPLVTLLTKIRARSELSQAERSELPSYRATWLHDSVKGFLPGADSNPRVFTARVFTDLYGHRPVEARVHYLVAELLTP